MAEALARRGEREGREERRRTGRDWASNRTVWKGTQCENGQLRSRAVLRGVSCEPRVGVGVLGDSLEIREREVRQWPWDGGPHTW